MALTLAGLVLAVLVAGFLLGPRPRLDATRPATTVPPGLGPGELEDWLAAQEQAAGPVIDGAEATIIWAGQRTVSDLCFVYVHGFSASRQETAPFADQVAAHFGANILYLRLAGHGLDADPAKAPGMGASAEAWLVNMVDGWELASRLGRKVILIATSNGAPLSLWLARHLKAREQIHGLIFLSPNFKIRKPFSFILTWPWAHYWLPWLAGRVQGLAQDVDRDTGSSAKGDTKDDAKSTPGPNQALVQRYWTSPYSIHDVIEMQKVVDWANRQSTWWQGIQSQNMPLATLYMDDDPTIDAASAVAFHQTWGAKTKALHRVEIDLAHPQHVFVGNIMAPHRLDWCVKTCIAFVESLAL